MLTAFSAGAIRLNFLIGRSGLQAGLRPAIRPDIVQARGGRVWHRPTEPCCHKPTVGLGHLLADLTTKAGGISMIGSRKVHYM